MLELDTRITVGKNARQGLGPDQLPMIDTQNLETVGPLAPDMIEGKLYSLDRRPDILVVAVNNDQAARTVAVELGYDVTQEPGQGRGGDVDRAGKGRTATGA